MKIRVLGASGAEVLGANQPAFLLDEKILFDAGSVTKVLDFSEQVKITHVFITHPHLDHISGLASLAENLILNDFNHYILEIYSLPEVIQYVKEHVFNNIIWPDFSAIPSTERPLLRFVPIGPNTKISVYAYAITPIPVNHTVPAVGYLMENKEGKKTFYTGDTGPTDFTWEILKGVSLEALITEVSFPNHLESLAILTKHLTPNLLKQELTKLDIYPKRVFIYHLKPPYRAQIIKELKESNLPNLIVLKDGDLIEIP